MSLRRVVDVGIVDSFAKDLLPQYAEVLCPVATVGDGNCVPRALSLHCFGDQDHHVELRCRIIIELVSNSSDYLDIYADQQQMLHLLSDSYCPDLKDTFELETLQVCKNHTYMGMWQLMAAANVFNCGVVLIYPSRGIKRYVDVFNRSIQPRHRLSTACIAILWYVTKEHQEIMPDEHWTANHVVPLMGLTSPVSIGVTTVYSKYSEE